MVREDLNLFEVWKPVKGFEGLYDISSEGRVWSYYSNKILKPSVDIGGYLFFDFRKDGKRYNKKVHRLVAEAFIPNPYNKPQINHLDENPKNNNVSNLEWVTQKENNNYGNHTKRVIDTKVQRGIIDPDSIGLSKSDKYKLWWTKNKEKKYAYYREWYKQNKLKNKYAD